MDESPRPSKRARKSCDRCRLRKQRCSGFPVCSNCSQANEECKQPASAIEEYRSGPNQALLERIEFLEAQLAAYNTGSDSDHVLQEWSSDEMHQTPMSPATSDGGKRDGIADIVGFLSLGGEQAYVGASSGFAMASSLGQMVQATVWNKVLAATVGEHQSKKASLAEIRRNAAGPPNEDMGDRILNSYFTKTHNRYPFLDRSEVMEQHLNRFIQPCPATPAQQFGTFKLYMVYAIGATMLKLTEPYDYTSAPEAFFMTALQYMSAAREYNAVASVEAMALLVLYNLRSPSNSGIFHMVGLGMRSCIDLGLHREAHYKALLPYEGQLRRRLFWSIYYLERVIAVSLGRPYSITDRDIDVDLPLEIDDTVSDDIAVASIQAANASTTNRANQPATNLTLGIQCIKLMRIESYIQTAIYRVDMPTASLVRMLDLVLAKLESFKATIPTLVPTEVDYLNMNYWKSVRLAIQPFLSVLPPNDARITLCLKASGQISQIFKRLHQRSQYGHSFIALHSVFISGLTMCYCLILSARLWNFSVAEDLRACSSALFVMAERTPSVKKYRDALESVISATMEHMGRRPSILETPAIPTRLPNKPSTTPTQSNKRSRKDYDEASTSSKTLEQANYDSIFEHTSIAAAAPWQRETFMQGPIMQIPLPSEANQTSTFRHWSSNNNGAQHSTSMTAFEENQQEPSQAHQPPYDLFDHQELFPPTNNQDENEDEDEDPKLHPLQFDFEMEQETQEEKKVPQGIDLESHGGGAQQNFDIDWFLAGLCEGDESSFLQALNGMMRVDSFPSGGF